ncbi:Phospholipase/carboxylesterase [Apodospora peruviana]|uniref:Phospholipase/carboxylesterase n=1 Tax=Apodospora peruviana TaxID=516989 RepID=A0AAE0LYN6_9PEZI|nr:Phospholipase/carboxylesterase [Apodospora peruviana]
MATTSPHNPDDRGYESTRPDASTIPQRPYIVGSRHGHAQTHTIIILHGRDAESAESFAGELFESEASTASPQSDPSSSNSGRTLLDLFPTVRWVFPSSAALEAERFGGAVLNQWFDMWSTDNPDERTEIQIPGLRQSIADILDLIQEEETLLDGRRDRIFLGGISQGFATAVSAYLADGRSMGGLIGLCSWMPSSSSLPNNGKERETVDAVVRALRKLYFGETTEGRQTTPVEPTPVFLGHAADDTVVSIDNGYRLCKILDRLLGPGTVDWYEYEDGGHWVNEPQGVDDMVAFLRANMGEIL